MLTAAQLEIRKGIITSTVLPGIVGLDPWDGPLTAQMKIKGIYSEPASAATVRGDLLERSCLAYARRVGEFDTPGLRFDAPGFRWHKEGWSGCTVDAVYRVDDKIIALGEAKTVGARQMAGWGAPGTDKVPDRILAQCCWHLRHWPEADVVWVPVLFGGFDFEFAMYSVRRNDRLIADLTNEAREFHRRYIVGDEIAPADHRDLQTIANMWPKNNSEHMTMTPELERWAAEKDRWRRVRKQAEEHEGTAHARIIEILRDHDGAVSDRVSVSYRACADRIATDWRGLARALGATQEQIAEHSQVKQGWRTLRVTMRELKS